MLKKLGKTAKTYYNLTKRRRWKHLPTFLAALAALSLTGCGQKEQEKTYELGEIPKAADFTPLSGSFYPVPDVSKIGEQTVLLVTEDGGRQDVVIRIEDTIAPDLSHAPDQIYAPEKKLPDLSHLDIRDADDDITISIDDSDIDLESPDPGCLMLAATDGSQNRSEKKIRVIAASENDDDKNDTDEKATGHDVTMIEGARDSRSERSTSKADEIDISGLDTDAIINDAGLDTEELSIIKKAVDILQSPKADDDKTRQSVYKGASEKSWHDMSKIDAAICDIMGWKYIQVLEGWANDDRTHDLWLTPADVMKRSEDRDLDMTQISDLYARCHIKKDDDTKTKAKKIEDMLQDQFEYTTEDIYPVDAIKQKKAGCLAWAIMYEDIARKAGIDISTVSGHASGMPHVWNRIRIDDRDLYTDLVYQTAMKKGYSLHDGIWKTHEKST